MKNIVLLIFVLAGLLSCKKTENGPAISLRSKDARVSNQWIVEQYLDDGVDKTELFAGSKFTFEKDGTCSATTPNGSFSGTWTLEKEDDDDDDENDLELEFKFSNKDKVIEELDGDWEVSKLKEKELWLDDDDDDNTILKFKEE